MMVGWLIDGTGEAVRRDMLLQIKGGIITSLEPCPGLDQVRGRVMDFSGCTLLPALADAHVHLCMSAAENRAVRREQPAASFDEAKPAIAEHLRQHLAYGILAVRDGGNRAGHTLRYRRENPPGRNFPVQLRAPGSAWYARGRYGKMIGRAPAAGETLDRAITRAGEIGDHVKIINSGINSLHEFGRETPAQFSQPVLSSAISAAGRMGLPAMVHANGKLPVRSAILAGSSSIEHGFFMGLPNLQLLAEKQIPWVPTAFTMLALQGSRTRDRTERELARRNLEHQLEQLQRALHYGVRVAAGTDSGSPGVRHGSAMIEELKILLKAGFSLPQTVRCAALNSAELLGLHHEFGRIAAGMPATFVITAGSPANLPDALTVPKRIFVRGRERGAALPARPDARIKSGKGNPDGTD
jgi:imidazolonepropionase-like amidohydrolase